MVLDHLSASSLEVDLVQSEACFDDLEALRRMDGMVLDGWMGLVIIGHGSSNKIQIIKIYENSRGGEIPN